MPWPLNPNPRDEPMEVGGASPVTFHTVRPSEERARMLPVVSKAIALTPPPPVNVARVLMNPVGLTCRMELPSEIKRLPVRSNARPLGAPRHAPAPRRGPPSTHEHTVPLPA